jgi:hypothetical protein
MSREPRRSRLVLKQNYCKENIMNHLRSTTATVIRTVTSRRGVRAVMLAGVAAASIGTATAASASTVHAGPAVQAGHLAHPDGYAPTEQCLNWSGTIEYFPALTKTTHSVTAVLSGTLSNCNLEGTDQTYSGSVFGDLTGTANNKGTATLSGNVAVTWPADADIDPTISPISISGSSSSFSFYGTPTAGFGAGQQLNGSYDVISSKAITGGTSQSILGSAPFQVEVNDG